MKPGVVACPKCQAALTSALCNTPAPVRCPACESLIQVEVFPAYFKSSTAGQIGETIIEEGVAGCFYHEQKKAVVPCDACGRFLCALCDVELEGKHYCPSCLQTGKSKGRMPQLESSRTVHDSAALTLCLAPLIIWPVTLLTAPVALYFAIASFSRPSSVVPRTRVRAWLAILLSSAQLIVWAFVFYHIFNSD